MKRPRCGNETEPKIHYYSGPHPLGVACGRWMTYGDRALVTRGKSLVTCPNCKRTLAFKAPS
jgi:hypothetical protein